MTGLTGTTVTVCICTYKRPELLRRALAAVAEQDTRGSFTYSIVVVDNDARQSAAEVVKAFGRGSTTQTTYDVETVPNIARARNRAVAHAAGEYVAFMDDDEVPAPDWLGNLMAARAAYHADGVLGPVRPAFDRPPPTWVVRGGFCERPEYATGRWLDWRQTRTGNVLVRRHVLAEFRPPFRPDFGNGGEDQDFFRRAMARGYRFVWCNEAVVHEVVPPERWRRRYMWRRALLRGQNERLLLSPKSLARSLVAVPVYLFAVPLSVLGGQHRVMHYSVRLLDHVGKLLGALGLKPLGTKYLQG
jgi:glycosyltransferase involved in cell wall biosynthesis